MAEAGTQCGLCFTLSRIFRLKCSTIVYMCRRCFYRHFFFLVHYRALVYISWAAVVLTSDLCSPMQKLVNDIGVRCHLITVDEHTEYLWVSTLSLVVGLTCIAADYCHCVYGDMTALSYGSFLCNGSISPIHN